jgi:hypothetical protein
MFSNVYVSTQWPCVLVSLSQNLNVTSKIDMVQIETQSPSLLPRIPGSGKDLILEVARDFDAPLELGT